MATPGTFIAFGAVPVIISLFMTWPMAGIDAAPQARVRLRNKYYRYGVVT
jgi:hypothetical protein